MQQCMLVPLNQSWLLSKPITILLAIHNVSACCFMRLDALGQKGQNAILLMSSGHGLQKAKNVTFFLLYLTITVVVTVTVTVFSGYYLSDCVMTRGSNFLFKLLTSILNVNKSHHIDGIKYSIYNQPCTSKLESITSCCF